MTKKVVRIGTRQSPLALAQSGEICKLLSRLHPTERFRLIKIRTAGDEFKSVEIFKKTGVGIFTKAIEKKLIQNKIDLAVHSLKDLPTTLPKGLVLAAIPKRLRTRDVLVSAKRHSLASLPRGAKVGTGSERRAAQIRRARPDLRLVAIRGNLDTRIGKALRTRELDAVVLAEAGLKRLNRYAKFIRPISETDILPAVGQGTLGIQTRKNDQRVLDLVKPIHDPVTACLVGAERAFLKTLGGGCRVPVGVESHIQKGRLCFTGAIFSTRTTQSLCGSFSATPAQGSKRASLLAKKLLGQGGRQLLREARS